MRNIKNFFNISLLALLVISFFAACKKDNATPTTPIEGDFSKNNSVQQIVTRSNDSDSLGLCFEIGYPLTVLLPDGNTETANSEEDLNDIYEQWFEENPDAQTCPAIVYPITVTLEDGTVQSVATEEELIGLLTDCFDIEIDFGWEDCFQIQYPVTVLFPDGTSAIVNSDSELGNAMWEWSENNPTDSLYPTLDYPIAVEKADGTVVEIADETGLNALFEECFGVVEPPVDPIAPCFEYVFPLTVALPDGTSATANSYEEMDAIILGWFENNPNDTTGFPTIVYPVNLQLEDGSIVTVNSDEEFYVVFDGCYGDGGGEEPGGFEECLTFNYPLTLVLPDGTTPSVASDEELYTAVFDWYENNPNSMEEPSFQYPISVTMVEDGTVLTVNSDEELNALFMECFECVIVNGDGLVLGGKQSVAAKTAIRQHAKIQQQATQKIAKLLTAKSVGF